MQCKTPSAAGASHIYTAASFARHSGSQSAILFNNLRVTVKESLNVARDRARSHDERCVERMNIFACYRTLGMADQGGDGHLGKAEIVGDARKAVAQDVRRNIR
jgi:hypothetical protein